MDFGWYYTRPAVSVDKQGRLSKVLGSISEIHHITNFNNRKLSMVGLNGWPIHFNVRPRCESSGNRQVENNYSDRELQILRLVTEGLSNMDISRKLSISVGTVRTHRKNILTKSSAGNSVQAVADAVRNEMIWRHVQSIPSSGFGFVQLFRKFC